MRNVPYGNNVVIGLLGGSFNPAHEGHVHLSLAACKQLGIKNIWWLVSPLNPLKKSKDMANYDSRVCSAISVTSKYKDIISVSEFERENDLVYTIDTIRKLKHKYPRIKFIWLMGADNLANMHKWKNWQDIMNIVSVAVFDRAPFSHRALRSPAAIAYMHYRYPAVCLRISKPPAWSYIFIPRNDQSSTKLRNLLGKAAFLRHN